MVVDHNHAVPDENYNSKFQPHRPCSTNDNPCQECSGLLELESQLAVAGNVYTDLLARHREMKTKVNQAHDPMCRRFPTEIVGRIFEFSSPRLTTVGSARQVVPDDFDSSAPLKLGAVCTTWRKIAWSTPSLWTSILIRFNPLKFPTRGILAQQWLQRSGSLPLYLFLHVTGSDNLKVAQHDAFDPIIKTINACSDRWRVLDVGLPTSLLTLLQPGSATKICPSIHTLRVSYRPSTEEDDINEGFNAPSLAPIAISLFGLRARSVNVKCDQLTIACAYDFGVEDVIEFLTRAPRLKSCTLQRQLFSMAAIPSVPYTHTELATLNVKNADESFGSLLDVIKLPALQHLTLQCAESPTTPTPILPSLTSCLGRSQCSLTGLTFTMRYSHQWSDMLSLLYAAPSIKQLTVEDEIYPPPEGKIFRQFTEAFSKSRSAPQMTDVLLPKLLDFKYREMFWRHTFGWRPLVESLSASAANFEDPRVTKMTQSFFLLIAEREASAWSTLFGDDLIDRDLIPDIIKIIHNGVSLGIHGITMVNENDRTFRGAYYDVIKASMEFHQFPQQDIDRYATLALPLPSLPSDE